MCQETIDGVAPAEFDHFALSYDQLLHDPRAVASHQTRSTFSAANGLCSIDCFAHLADNQNP
jgi:hypothetical protein